MKKSFKPGTMLYPLPVVMVSCGDSPENYNIITVAWTGTICSDPPMCYISIRKNRHSYDIIKKTGEFVINLTTDALAKATDWCGVRSGRDYNKFKEMHLTPEKAQVVNAPLIAESPLNIECKVVEIKELGSHDMFMAQVVAVNGDEKYFDPSTELFQLNQAELITYSHGKYYTLGEKIGKFGFSVEKIQHKRKTSPVSFRPK
ncbi:MAG: flavin reductase family protein [Bacteroidales bacterium]|nr:flavin reductase family protein [Bacteroidales bacterium]